MHVHAFIDIFTISIPSETNHRDIAGMSLHDYRFILPFFTLKKNHRGSASMSLHVKIFVPSPSLLKKFIEALQACPCMHIYLFPLAPL